MFVAVHLFNCSIIFCIVLVPGTTYLGCFIDEATRDLPHLPIYTDTMTPDSCGLHCIGYQYMSTQVNCTDTVYNMLYNRFKTNLKIS